MTVSTDLRAAADLIEERGWVQKIGYDSKGRICMAHAIQVATGVFDHRQKWHENMSDAEWHAKRDALDERYRYAIHAVKSALGRSSIPDWNDEDGRTKEEVVTALRGTADIWEATGGKVTYAHTPGVQTLARVHQELVSA